MSDEVTHPPIRPLLRVGDFLRVVPVSRNTLDRLIETGQLATIKIGRRRFFRPEDVERFLKSCSDEPDSP